MKKCNVLLLQSTRRQKNVVFFSLQKRRRTFILLSALHSGVLPVTLSPIDLMAHDFTPGDVVRITGREASTIRYARLRGKIKGLKGTNGGFKYNLYEIVQGFGKTQKHEKWSSAELKKLKLTKTCEGRSSDACTTMLWRIKNGR